MNNSMLPLFGFSRVADKLRVISASINNYADAIEAKLRLTPSQKTILNGNSSYSDKHKGMAAFVIVNGPSLARQDISWLGEYITFCVSGFWKHEAVTLWQPTYYSLLDKNFFNNSEATSAFYTGLKSRINHSTFFLPLYRGYDAVDNYKLLPLDRCQFVASIGSRNRGVDLTNIVGSFAGVSSFALSQAIYMGCSPIYLLGFDHDYLANRGIDRHFYTGGTIPGHKMTNVPLADRVPYDDEMRANLRLWGDYRNLKREAEKKGVQILNATDGGYLDVFDRVDFDSLKFSLANKSKDIS